MSDNASGDDDYSEDCNDDIDDDGWLYCNNDEECLPVSRASQFPSWTKVKLKTDHYFGHHCVHRYRYIIIVSTVIIIVSIIIIMMP